MIKMWQANSLLGGISDVAMREWVGPTPPPPTYVQTPLEMSANPLKSLFYIGGGISCMYTVTYIADQQRKMVRTSTMQDRPCGTICLRQFVRPLCLSAQIQLKTIENPLVLPILISTLLYVMLNRLNSFNCRRTKIRRPEFLWTELCALLRFNI